VLRKHVNSLARVQGGKEGKINNAEKVFLSIRQHIKIHKRVTNLNDFQKCVSRRTVFGYYGKGEFPATRK
jgi:hypothetical protein